jgi:hypothetical protein
MNKLKYLLEKKNRTNEDCFLLKNLCKELGYSSQYNQYLEFKEEESFYPSKRTTSSFFENSALYGPQMNVSGGLSVEHRYIVSLNKIGLSTLFYVGLISNQILLTEEKKNAKQFHYNDVKKVLELLSNNKELENIKTEPYAHYETIRD